MECVLSEEQQNLRKDNQAFKSVFGNLNEGKGKQIPKYASIVRFEGFEPWKLSLSSFVLAHTTGLLFKTTLH